MMDGTAAKGERIRASRGYYEAEVSCTGETGLQQCLIMCQKNPGHKNFIPTNNFNIEHLPSRYQDKILVDYVKATSDLTCRLSVTDISKDRPETWPDSDQAFPFSAHKGENFMMAGTGWVRGVYRYTGNDKLICECDECRQPLSITQKKTWGIFYIRTACHVVYDSEEARHTKCQFFYDSPETNMREVLTLTGLKVVEKDVKADWCRMKFITHDEELLDKFYKMWWHWDDLRNKVYTKYMSPGVECDTDAKHDLCIVVSHPHGCTKQISVGNVTHRCVWYAHLATGGKISCTATTRPLAQEAVGLRLSR